MTESLFLSASLALSDKLHERRRPLVDVNCHVLFVSIGPTITISCKITEERAVHYRR